MSAGSTPNISLTGTVTTQDQQSQPTNGRIEVKLVSKQELQLVCVEPIRAMLKKWYSIATRLEETNDYTDLAVFKRCVRIIIYRGIFVIFTSLLPQNITFLDLSNYPKLKKLQNDLKKISSAHDNKKTPTMERLISNARTVCKNLKHFTHEKHVLKFEVKKSVLETQEYYDIIYAIGFEADYFSDWRRIPNRQDLQSIFSRYLETLAAKKCSLSRHVKLEQLVDNFHLAMKLCTLQQIIYNIILINNSTSGGARLIIDFEA
ncbi:MAG: hypothetical protein MHMPM18_002248 [Marteilia pararefringens]